MTPGLWPIQTVAGALFFGWCSTFAAENWKGCRVRSILALVAGIGALVGSAVLFAKRPNWPGREESSKSASVVLAVDPSWSTPESTSVVASQKERTT